MKILIVTLEYPPLVGGIASYVCDFARHIDPKDVIVYAPDTREGVRFDAANKFKTYRRNPFFSLFWPRWIRAWWQIIRIVKREKIEMIHIHHILPMGYIALIIKRLFKVPYTVFLHGSDLYFSTKTPLKRSNFNRICRQAHTVVVNSQFCKQKLDSIVGELSSIKIIYPCPSDDFFDISIDQKRIDQIKSELALNGKKTIISVSRLVERKGHALFVSALELVLKKIPNAIWLIVGDGPEKKMLTEMINARGLQSVVRFLPSMPAHETAKYYHCADLFALLTHQDKDGVEEAWGIVFLEASACGLPIIAGRSGGVEEAVLNNETGLIVDARNIKQTANSIIDLLNNPDYSRRLGDAGRERAREEFRWQKQLRKFS
ncbi:MAG: glycosyltransferase family 4 protein [Candidatus Magasanikbacteria bacterium]